MNWQQWKTKYHRELQHIAGYEERFVDLVLCNIPNLQPSDVIPQYHFKDSTGKNRYIDFMIINQDKNWLLPIELDGYTKMVGNGNDYERFNDFLERQNAMISKFGLVLRYSNKAMFNQSYKILAEISDILYKQTQAKNIKDTQEVNQSTSFKYQNLSRGVVLPNWHKWCKYYDVEYNHPFVEKFLKKINTKADLFTIKHADDTVTIIQYKINKNTRLTLVIVDDVNNPIYENTQNDTIITLTNYQVYDNTNVTIKEINQRITKIVNLKKKQARKKFINPFLIIFKLLALPFKMLNMLGVAVESSADQLEKETIQIQIAHYKQVHNLPKEAEVDIEEVELYFKNLYKK